MMARDPRFDGRFFTGVTSTGIYCRPICPARTPARGNMRFFAHAATAEAAGFRACRRCRPEASPGSPEWNVRADLAARAVRLIADGYVDSHGIGGLAARLAVTQRHLHRLLVAELGAGPQALARTARLQTARRLLAETSMPITEVAFASGFSSVRQFNASVRESSGRSPSELRARARRTGPGGQGARDSAGAPGTWLTLRLAYREPFDAAGVAGLPGRTGHPGGGAGHRGPLRPVRADRRGPGDHRAHPPAGPGPRAAPGPAQRARGGQPGGRPGPAAARRRRRPGRDRRRAGHRRPARPAGAGPARAAGARRLRRLRAGGARGPRAAGLGRRGEHVRGPPGRPARHPAGRRRARGRPRRTRPGGPAPGHAWSSPARTCWPRPT